jgi:hypothetical protein
MIPFALLVSMVCSVSMGHPPIAGNSPRNQIRSTKSLAQTDSRHPARTTLSPECHWAMDYAKASRARAGRNTKEQHKQSISHARFARDKETPEKNEVQGKPGRINVPLTSVSSVALCEIMLFAFTLPAVSL